MVYADRAHKRYFAGIRKPKRIFDAENLNAQAIGMSLKQQPLVPFAPKHNDSISHIEPPYWHIKPRSHFAVRRIWLRQSLRIP